MTPDLPQPMTPPDCNLRGLPWMPLETGRLLDSDLFLLSTGDEFKAAVALWCKSWNQIPGGSLPSDERLLEALSGSRSWKKVRDMAMRGWVKCSDGRLYHPVIADLAVQAWDGRQVHMEGVDAKKSRQQRWREQLKELSARLRDAGVTPPANASKTELERLIALHVDGHVDAQPSTKASRAPSTGDAHEMANKGEGQGQGERQGELIPPVPDGTAPPSRVSRQGASAGDGARKRSSAEATRPDDVEERVWNAFLAQRKAKRAPLTDIALEGIAKEAKAAGLSLNDAIAYSCSAGWQGFNAGWYANREGSGRAPSGGHGQPRSNAGRHSGFTHEHSDYYDQGVPDDGSIPA